jgi:molecular chaperone DnaK
MTITGGSALPKEDIERMMREAEQYAEEDRKRRDEVETRNQAEGLVYQTEKFLADNADKFESGAAADAKSNVTGPLEDLKKALTGDDIAAIKSATETLARASQSLGAALYQNAQAAAGPGDVPGADAGAAGAASASGEDDDVVDAEIVDDGDQK